LAQEARFIRHEEERIKKRQKVDIWGRDTNSQFFWKLRSHRKIEVSEAARAAQLAYGFLRGIPYRKIEAKTHPSYTFYRIIKEVKRLATKFSSNGKINFDSEIDEWLKKVLDT